MSELEKNAELQKLDNQFERQIEAILLDYSLMQGYTKKGGMDSARRKIVIASAENQAQRLAIINKYMKDNLL